MAESQMAELQNIRVLLEEARAHVGNLAGHRRARLEVHIRGALREIDDQIEDLRPSVRSWWRTRRAGALDPVLRPGVFGRTPVRVAT
jgi:hypothetical protein